MHAAPLIDDAPDLGHEDDSTLHARPPLGRVYI